MRALAVVEQQHILFALATCDFNLTRTAKELDIGLRTLQRKLRKYGYDPHSMQIREWIFSQPVYLGALEL